MSTFTLKFNRTNSAFVVIDLCEVVEKDGKKTFPVKDTVELSLAEVPDELTNGEAPNMSLAAYGLLKLVQDRNSALSEKALGEMGLTGREAQYARIDAFQETYELLKSGLWRAASTNVGKSASIDPIFAAAVAELKGCTIVQATTALKAADKDSRLAIRNLPAVKAIMERMRNEAKDTSEDSGLDLSDLL